MGFALPQIVPGRAAQMLVGLALLAGCANQQEPAPVVFRGTEPTAPAQAAPAQPLAPPATVAAAPDARGIVDYGGYRAMIARPGDTVDGMAARAGLTGAALAAYNGLPTGFVPRPGDELILPPEAQGQVAAADGAVAAAPLAPPAGEQAGSTFDLDRIGETLDEPATPTAERAAPGDPAQPLTELAAPPAPSARPTATPAPIATETPAAVAAAPAPAAAARSARFVRPVDGTISRPFSRAAGAERSDGVSFAAPAGSRVVAVDDGQVALVSEALGGDLGTVVLIRHGGQILTVYGRIDPQVTQGERVTRGQTIGTVAATGEDAPSMHFEVRRGTEPVDPQPFFDS